MVPRPNTKCIIRARSFMLRMKPSPSPSNFIGGNSQNSSNPRFSHGRCRGEAGSVDEMVGRESGSFVSKSVGENSAGGESGKMIEMTSRNTSGRIVEFPVVKVFVGVAQENNRFVTHGTENLRVDV